MNILININIYSDDKLNLIHNFFSKSQDIYTICIFEYFSDYCGNIVLMTHISFQRKKRKGERNTKKQTFNLIINNKI